MNTEQTTPSPQDENPTKDAQTPANGPAAPPESKSKESVRTTFFSELMPLTESVINTDAREVDVTLIRPGWSANGKYYSKAMLSKAVAAFEGARAYVNHPTLTESKDRPERDVRDMAGYYKNVRQADDGAVKGTLKMLGRNGDEMFPLVVEAITNKPDLLGLSINAMGKTAMGEAEGRKGVLVEEIVGTRFTSTDIVTTPAAGGKFERLMASDDGMTADLLAHLDYEEWRESRPDFVARIKTEMRTARKEELTEAAVQEVATLREQVTQLQTTTKELEEAKTRAETDASDLRAANALRETELTADRKLTESKLPDTWKTDLKPRLLGLTESDMDTLIETDKKKYFSVKQPVPVKESGAGVLTTADAAKPELIAVAESLGINPNLPTILEGESPEQWKARIAKLR